MAFFAIIYFYLFSERLAYEPKYNMVTLFRFATACTLAHRSFYSLCAKVQA